uniref:hypothetical protein n=1 Tax=Vibrio cholerae TaxID=666 RepID=UPI003F58A1C1
MREDTTANLLSALRSGELDVLILALPVDIGNMESYVVGQDPFRMVISRNQVNQIACRSATQIYPMNSVFTRKRALFN